MNIIRSLDDLGLNPDNSVVIGSGILSALHLRNSNDIDVVVTNATYQKLAQAGRFTKTQSYGKEVLVDGLFEIGTSWGVLGKSQTFENLSRQSTVIQGVRYITLDFLLAVKESWLKGGDARQKDKNDVMLIKEYVESKK